MGKDKKSITDYILSDGENEVSISKFGTPSEGIQTNDEVFCSKVKVDEYNGRRGYLINGAIEPAMLDGEEDNA